MINVGRDTLLMAAEKISLAVRGVVKLTVLGKSKRVKTGSYSSLEAFDGASMQIASYFLSVIEEERDLVFNLDGKSFISVIKVLSKLNKDFVLSVDGNSMVISAGETKVRLPLFKECTLITMENDPPYALIDVKKDEFFAALARGGYANGDLESFSGLYLQCVDGEGIEVSTANSSRFAVAFCAAKYDLEKYKGANLKAYLPIGITKALSVFSDESITLCFMNNKFVIKGMSSYLVMNKFKAEFAGVGFRKWKSDVTATMLISKKSILTALEVSMLTDDVKDNPVIIASEDTKLFMKTPLGSAKALIDGTVSGEIDEIYISPLMLREAVNVTGEKIQVEYYGKNTPLRILSEKDDKANFAILSVVDGSKSKRSSDKKEAEAKEAEKK